MERAILDRMPERGVPPVKSRICPSFWKTEIAQSGMGRREVAVSARISASPLIATLGPRSGDKDRDKEYKQGGQILEGEALEGEAQ